MMNKLTERQKIILTLIIHEYIRVGNPVSSNHLVKRYNLDISSATVRNELSILTELGYLYQPHISAGRVPTEDGYRHFVRRLLQESDLPETTQRMISHQFYQTRHDVEQWMRLAASILANQSQVASLVTAPHPEQARFKHLELISTHGHQVLIILVMLGGEIHQHIITASEPISQEQLSVIANRITELFQGKNAETIQHTSNQLESLAREVAEWIIEDMKQADSLAAGEVYLDGITNVLAKPEFTSSGEARRALRLLEERTLLQDLLSRTVLSGNIGGVQVLIGGEGTWEDLRYCSIVLSRYGAPGLASGTLGVLGPLRMSYERSISTVRFISNLLSDLVTETLGNSTLSV